jgi:TRAP-type C4-dicarboxylate transport system permease small subunit
MTALPFLFVLLVRGLEAIDRRVATSAAAMLAVLFVAIDLHGTWVQMPTHYASTTDATLQWSRLTVIHPAVLSGDRRWLFLATYLGALCLVVGGLVYAWRDARRPVVSVLRQTPPR